VAFQTFVQMTCNNPNSGIVCTFIYNEAQFVDAHFDVPNAPTVRITAYEMYKGFEAARKELKPTPKFGKDFIAALEWSRDKYNYVIIACQSGAVACVALAGTAGAANPLLGLAAAAVCTGAGAVCTYSQEKFNKAIDETIAAIKAACAEGDEQCYDAVISARYPGWATESSGGGVTGDAQGSGTTPGSGASPSGPTTPTPKLPEGKIEMGETPPAGGAVQPIDPCKANPKATGCSRPPKHEM
jgi:hypothetical protein